MQGPRMLLRAALPVLILLGACAAALAAGGEAVPLRARPLVASLQHRAPGALTAETWPLLEAAFRQADPVAVAELAPRVAALRSGASAQSWFNWPPQKLGSVRRLQEEARRAQARVDQVFFAAALAAVEAAPGGAASPLAAALRGAAMERARVRSPAWPLLRGSTVDLEVLARTLLRPEVEADPAVRAVLARWAAERAQALAAQEAVRGAAFDRLEAALRAAEVDPDRLGAPADPWLEAACDAWEKCSGDLASEARRMLAADVAALDALSAVLPPEDATSLRRRAMIARMWEHDMRPVEPAEGAFRTALRIRELTPGTRAAIGDARLRWWQRDLALLEAADRATVGQAPSYFPLTYHFWGEGDARSPAIRGIAERCRAERVALAEAARAEVAAILGPLAELLPADSSDPRLDPPPVNPADPTAVVEAQAAWHPRPSLSLFIRPAPQPGWFDPGILVADDMRTLAAWFGLGEEGTVAWLQARADAEARLAAQVPPDLQERRSGWEFHQSYVYNEELGEALLGFSIERQSQVLREEQSLFELAAAAVPTDSQRRRVAMAAAARRAQLRLHPLRQALGAQRWEHTGEVLLPMVALQVLSATPWSQAPDPEEGGLLAEIQPLWMEAVGAADARMELLTPLVHAQAGRYDRGMWAGDKAGAAARERQVVEWRRITALDREARLAFVATQERLAALLAARAGADGAAIIAAWEALAFPSVHAADPEAALLLADRESGAVAAAYWPQEEALVSESRRQCMASDEAALDPLVASTLRESLEWLRELRAELSDRAVLSASLGSGVRGSRVNGASPRRRRATSATMRGSL